MVAESQESEAQAIGQAADDMLPHLQRPANDTSVSHAAADREAEARLIAYYLVGCCEPVATSKCEPWHFGWAPHRKWWARAKSIKTIAQPSDLGLPPSAWAELSERPLILQREVAAYEDRVIRAASARQLATRLNEVCGSLAANGAEYLSEAVAKLREATTSADAGMPSTARTQAEIGTEVIRNYFESCQGEHSDRIVPMIPKLQELIGGWVRGKLFLVVGRSSEQKTTVLRTAAEYVARWLTEIGRPGRALGWTFEDSASDLAARTISSEVPYLSYRDLGLGIRPTNATADDVQRMWSAVKKAPEAEWCERLVWLDKGSPTLSEVCSRIKTEAAKDGGLHFVTLEYGQLIRPDRGFADTQHWEMCAAQLATLAKELDIPIVLALQIDKTATKESLADNRRPPITEDAKGGVAWKHACFGSLCIAAQEGLQSRKLVVQVDKWKAGAKGEAVLWVDPARDRID